MTDLSVLLPTYNYGDWIAEALQSVLDQIPDGVVVEIVVADDGSTDQTGDVVRGFDERVKYFRQDNAGPAAARNLALREARGRYLMFLDSDDSLVDGCIETTVRFLDDHPEVGLFFTNYDIYDDEGVVSASGVDIWKRFRGLEHREVADDGWIFSESLTPHIVEGGAFMHTSGLTIRREVYEQIGPFLEGYAYGATQGCDLPQPIACAHETVAMPMAYGVTLVTGKPQAVMLHTNVGLANGVMGLLNAASDQVPMLLLSGRTPIVETGRHGRRDAGIHWGQEMRDQNALVREACKWDYDARFGDQIPGLLDRALAIAESAPQGPVYLALAREMLGEAWPEGTSLPGRRLQPAEPSRPSADAIERAAKILAEAERPLIVTQRSGTDARAWAALVRLAEDFALPIGPATGVVGVRRYRAASAVDTTWPGLLEPADLAWDSETFLCY